MGRRSRAGNGYNGKEEGMDRLTNGFMAVGKEKIEMKIDVKSERKERKEDGRKQ